MGTWLFEPGHTAAMSRARHKRGAKALQQAPSLRVGEAPNWNGGTAWTRRLSETGALPIELRTYALLDAQTHRRNRHNRRNRRTGENSSLPSVHFCASVRLYLFPVTWSYRVADGN